MNNSRLLRSVLLSASLAAGLVACKKSGGSNEPREDPKDAMAMEKILNQAAFDLSCDKSQLTIQKISDDHEMMGVKNATWGVRGCEKQATYKSSCGMGNCQILNDAQAQAAGM